TAIGALAEMKVQEARLEDLAANARASGIALPKNAETAKAAAIQKAREWAAADQLLALFADPELFTEPNKATTWLPKVQAQFARMQTEGGKELIRKKVQQFCDAYIPRAARLDAEVLIQGKREPRKGVTIEYDSDAKSQPLSDVTDKLNEFNFKAMHKGFDRIVWSNGNRFTGDAGALRPTPRSIAARDFTRARAGMTEWTPASINQLKMKCEAGLDALQLEERHRLLDELIGAGEGPEWTPTNTRIWTRLTALAAAMEKHRVLFEAKKQ
ncbi:MAG TPA: hypothetical protein VLM40_06890, partial [Gemmata sp.]|nr:hypothetical protein [Gemmata sp.]